MKVMHRSLLISAGAALLASVAAAEEQSCGGLLGGNCPSDFFCSYPLGACGDAILGGSSEAGVCKPLPMFCSAHIDPVCACNGRALETFTNECMANMKGFSVKAKGECPESDGILSGRTDEQATTADTAAVATGTSTTVCSSSSNVHCAAGYVCIYAAGHECGAGGGEGRCEPTGGMMCSQAYEPVCGCDGKTYANACISQYEHGVSVMATGVCGSSASADDAGILNRPKKDPPQDVAPDDGSGGLLQPRPCGGPDQKGCPLHQFCQLPQGACTTGNPHPEGVCAKKPLTCNEHTLPQVTQVCGCSLTTYRTECHANREGESVLYRGACFSPAGAVVNEQADPNVCGAHLANRCTAEGQFCEYQPGVCGLYDAVGSCSAKPDVCAQAIDPVCGCDDKSYTNACEARRAGVSVKSSGYCLGYEGGLGGGGGSGGLVGSKDAVGNATIGGMCGEGMPCPAGAYCAFEPGRCLIKQEMGICVVQPTSCSPSSKSGVVCGCSGATFSTKCDAAMAGESIMAEASCLQMSSGAIASGRAVRGALVIAFAMAAACLALAGLA